MASPEGRVKRWLDTMLKAEGVWYFCPQAGPYGSAGIPDRIAIICGLFVGIEVKANSKCKMTALQLRCAETIRDAGGYHFLVYDKETVEHVRTFIQHVRLNSPRQKSNSACNERPRLRARRNPYGKASKRQPSVGPPQAGGDSSSTEPGILHPLSNSVLLYLARPIQSDDTPADHVSLPN